MTCLRNFILIFLAASLAGCRSSGNNAAPNIILFLADDLGYNDLSCYRERHETESERPPTAVTPHIDRLASEGMLFTDFYCGAAVCSPSRAALLTGRNCTRVGIYNWIPPRQPMHLRSGEVTIAEMLKQAGYRTAHFGKWHLTAEGMGQPLPMDQGYDHAFYSYNNARPSHKDPVNFFRDTVALGAMDGFSCQLVADEAIGWLRDNAGSGDPFYINIWFNEPHEKVAAPDSLVERHAYHPHYYGCIENMDHAVGRVRAFLEESGLSEQTIIIFTSDNGSQVPGSNDPLRGEKAFNFEGGIKVPFIACGPGRIPPGRVSGVTGSFTDLLPSLAAITGTQPPSGRKLDGEDLSAVFTGKMKIRERNAGLFFFRYFHDPVCMLREGKWVLLGYIHEPLPYMEDYPQAELANLKPEPDQPGWSMWGFQEAHQEFLESAVPVNFQLFDIRSDPGQETDLSASHRDVLENMKKTMLTLRREMIAEGGDWYR